MNHTWASSNLYCDLASREGQVCGEVDLTCCTHQGSLCSLFPCQCLFFFPPAEHRPGDHQFSLSQISSDLYHAILYQVFRTTVVFLSGSAFILYSAWTATVPSSLFLPGRWEQEKNGKIFYTRKHWKLWPPTFDGLSAAGMVVMVQQFLCLMSVLNPPLCWPFQVQACLLVERCLCTLVSNNLHLHSF